MMPEEEKMILHWINQYEVITTEQAIRLLHHKSRGIAIKIIRGLQKQHYISYINEGACIGAYPCSVPDPKTIEALWVLIQFEDKIKQYDHRPASYPSQIFFLKEEVGYEIIVLHEGDQHLARLLEPTENLKYIFVVPNAEMISQIPLPDAPCIFAVVKEKFRDAADVTFYSKEE